MNKERVKAIAAEYGTPLYVYDGEIMERQYHALKQCLPETFEIFYSVKTNPLLGVCQFLKSLGSHIEVASIGELYLVVQAGYHPDQIIFTSPGKTIGELEEAIERQIYCINIESLQEALMIHDIALRKATRVNIAIRINPDFNIAGASMKMTGVSTQFGIDESAVSEAVKAIQSLRGVRLIGIHVFTGTQMLHADNIVRTIEAIMKLALDLSEAHAFPLEFLDLGGGFGIPYFKGEEPLELEKLKAGISQVWEIYRERLAGTRIAVESGRFLMAESGVFVTKVLYVKESKGSKYLVCDGGSNHHASTAFLGRHVRNNFPMRLLGKEDEAEVVNVVGALCTPSDVLGQKVTLGSAEPGDFLVIDQSGAYGLTHSPVMFLSHPMPAEVIYYGEQVQILRERGQVEDFLRGQHKWVPEDRLLRIYG